MLNNLFNKLEMLTKYVMAKVNRNRLCIGITLSPESIDTIHSFAKNNSCNNSRAVDSIIREWLELNSARNFRERQQAKTIQELKARITTLESHIKVISATTRQILQFHQVQHSVEKRSKRSNNLNRVK